MSHLSWIHERIWQSFRGFYVGYNTWFAAYSQVICKSNEFASTNETPHSRGRAAAWGGRRIAAIQKIPWILASNQFNGRKIWWNCMMDRALRCPSQWANITGGNELQRISCQATQGSCYPLQRAPAVPPVSTCFREIHTWSDLAAEHLICAWQWSFHEVNVIHPHERFKPWHVVTAQPFLPARLVALSAAHNPRALPISGRGPAIGKPLQQQVPRDRKSHKWGPGGLHQRSAGSGIPHPARLLRLPLPKLPHRTPAVHNKPTSDSSTSHPTLPQANRLFLQPGRIVAPVPWTARCPARPPLTAAGKPHHKPPPRPSLAAAARTAAALPPGRRLLQTCRTRAGLGQDPAATAAPRLPPRVARQQLPGGVSEGPHTAWTLAFKTPRKCEMQRSSAQTFTHFYRDGIWKQINICKKLMKAQTSCGFMNCSRKSRCIFISSVKPPRNTSSGFGAHPSRPTWMAASLLPRGEREPLR